MKKILIILALADLMAMPSNAQKIPASQVPAAVKSSFTRQFSGSTSKWEKEGENYEAGFKLNRHEMSALFDSNGTLMESEMEIPVTSLLPDILTYVKAHYPGASIKEAAKITKGNGELNYEAAIKGKDLIFDSKGSFIKELKD